MSAVFPVPPHPLVLELHSRSWLARQRASSLAQIPDPVFQSWQDLGMTHIWLMGAWQIGPAARRHALQIHRLRSKHNTPPGAIYGDVDIIGSPYAIAGYLPARELGGYEGLMRFRESLHRHRMGLLLDYIPNHVALDHPWVADHPGRFIHGFASRPGTFRALTRSGHRHVAHGKDPHFPPWTDTAQLDWRSAEVHQSMFEELLKVAELCDGVRVDMAMLILRDVFERQWGDWPMSGSRAAKEFWPDAIHAVKARHHGFAFLAEAYWDEEPRLIHSGFHFAYDKRFYDHLVTRNPEGLREHLRSLSGRWLDRGARFLENHDEPRIRSLCTDGEHQAWAAATLFTPGLRLLHDGQMEGIRGRSEIQLCQVHPGGSDDAILSFYNRLLRLPGFQGGDASEWVLIEPERAWEGNETFRHYHAMLRRDGAGLMWILICNLAPHASQCRLRLPLPSSTPDEWDFEDLWQGLRYSRSGRELELSGLFVDLPAHGFHFFRIVRPAG